MRIRPYSDLKGKVFIFYKDANGYSNSKDQPLVNSILELSNHYSELYFEFAGSSIIYNIKDNKVKDNESSLIPRSHYSVKILSVQNIVFENVNRIIINLLLECYNVWSETNTEKVEYHATGYVDNILGSDYSTILEAFEKASLYPTLDFSF